MDKDLSIELLSVFLSGALLPIAAYLIYNFVRRQCISIHPPVVENPYGNTDYGRDMPRKLRFVRVRVSSRIFRVERAFCTMEVEREDGATIDAPGILHWQRQPRSGVAHPGHLHKLLRDEEDVLRHMLEFHFVHSAPVDIPAGRDDKVDLFLRIEKAPFAVPAISRENRIEPGRYRVKILLDAANLHSAIAREFTMKLTDDIDFIEVSDWRRPPRRPNPRS